MVDVAANTSTTAKFDLAQGGLNNDTFVFNTTLSSTLNRDVITDFVSNSGGQNDVIHLENAIFTALTAGAVVPSTAFKANASGVATDGDDRIVYNTTNGALIYDTNGNAAGGAIVFAFLTSKPTITFADFFVI